MKNTRKRPLAVNVAPLFAMGLMAASLAEAQTVTQLYADSGTPTGSLSAIGFDSYQYSIPGGPPSPGSYDTIGTEIGIQGANAFGTDWSVMNYAFSSPTAPAGYALTGVNLSLYVASLGPAATTTIFSIYSELDRTGGVIGTFSLAEPSTVGTYQDIAIPLLALTDGFSLGYAASTTIQPIVTTYTEGYTEFSQRPSVTFTYSAIPEPSLALLAPLGLALALRRRRRPAAGQLPALA